MAVTFSVSVITSLFIVIMVFFGYLLLKRKKAKAQKAKEESLKNIHEAPGDIDEVIKIIKEEGGRTTQKEIRKRIPLSEAKISFNAPGCKVVFGNIHLNGSARSSDNPKPVKSISESPEL